MDSVTSAVAIAVIVAMTLSIIYWVLVRRERGRDPHYAREVYYLYSALSPDPRAAAAAYGAVVASVSQVAAYVTAGGEAPGCGLVSEDLARGSPAARGVWLYGAKPRRGTRYVAPFSRAYWFHPSHEASPKAPHEASSTRAPPGLCPVTSRSRKASSLLKPAQQSA